MSNYNIHNYLPYQPGQVVFVLIGSTITQGLCAAYHVAGNSYTYDVSFPPATSTTNYPQSEVFNTYSNAQIALQLQTSPTPTLSPTNTPTPSVTRSITPTPSMTPSYTGAQFSSNLFSTLTATGGTVAQSGNSYTFTSTGGNPAKVTSTISGIVDYKLYKLTVRYDQMTGKNAAFTLTSSGPLIQQLIHPAALPATNIIQNNGTGVLFSNLDGSGLLETTFQVTAGTTLAFEADFYDDNNFVTAMATGKTYGLQLTLVEVLPSVAISPTPSPTVSISATPTVTPTISVTPSVTATISVTPSITHSVTPTITVSPSITPTITPTISVTPSVTPTHSVSPTISVTPSITPSITVTPTLSVTPT